MKKRLIAVMLLLCICMAMIPLKAEAATSGKCGDNVRFSFSESTGLLKIYGTGDMWDFRYNYGYSSAPWWEYVAKIKKVEIGSGVTRIGNTAFNGCWNAEIITIPETVVSIGSKAFYGCTALSSITIPSQVTAIESYTFYRTGITEIDLPDGLTSLGVAAFADSSLTSIDIPAGVTTINSSLFSDCTNLEKVTIRGNITNIGAEAFYDTALKELTFEGTLSGEIGDHAFAYCENLPYFHVPGTVTDIEDYAFCGCEGLTELTLAEGLTSIGDSAFRETGISTLTIPSTVDYFGNDIAVFADNLKNVTLYSQSLENCKSYIFNSRDLDYVHVIGDAPNTTVKVFASVKQDSNFIVYYDEGTSGWEGDDWNGYLIAVWDKPWPTKTGTCGQNVNWSLNADGVLTISGTGPMKDVAFDDAPWYRYRDRIQKVVVEENVTTVGQSAFHDLYNLKSAEIAGSVESIKHGAFDNCKLMDSLVLNEGLKAIEGFAFWNCAELTSVDLPDSVTTLGSSAFSDCYGLETVYMPESLTKLTNAAFTNCGIKEIYFPADAPAFESNSFENITANVYYPAGNATWTEDVMQNYGGTITWVPYYEESAKLTVTAGNNADGKPTLAWEKIDGAVEYRVYRSAAQDGTYARVFTTKGKTYTHTSAVAGNSYYYYVKAIMSDGTESDSEVIKNTYILPTQEFEVTTGNNAEGKPTLKWTGVNGATEYRVYRSATEDGNFAKVFTTKGKTYTHASAIAGNSYYYYVKAIKGDGSEEDSGIVTNTCLEPDTFAITTGNNASGKPTLKWTAAANADHYEVYRSATENGTYVRVFTTAGKTYTHTSATAGNTYYYKVKIVSKNGTGQFSHVVMNSCLIPETVFSIVTGHNTAGKPTLKWTAIPGADRYEVYRADTSDGEYVKAFSTKGTTYTNTSAKAGNTYYYKLKVYLSDGTEKSSDAVVNSCPIPGVVFNIETGNNAAGKPTLKWTAIAGADHYEVYRANSADGEYVKAFSTKGITYTNTSAKAGNTYYYKLTVYLTDGTSKSSEVIPNACLDVTA